MHPARISFEVRTHQVSIEKVDARRWRVCVDGRMLASFSSESRARSAGRIEARRLDLLATDRRR